MTFLKTPEFMSKDNNTVLDKICFNTLNMIIPKSQYDFMTLIDLECSLTGCKITTPHGQNKRFKLYITILKGTIIFLQINRKNLTDHSETQFKCVEVNNVGQKFKV